MINSSTNSGLSNIKNVLNQCLYFSLTESVCNLENSKLIILISLKISQNYFPMSHLFIYFILNMWINPHTKKRVESIHQSVKYRCFGTIRFFLNTFLLFAISTSSSMLCSVCGLLCLSFFVCIFSIVSTICLAYSYPTFSFSMYYFMQFNFSILSPNIFSSFSFSSSNTFRNLSVFVWKSHIAAFEID